MEETIIDGYEIDGKDYAVVKVVDYKNEKYVLLVNVNEDGDMFLRKYVNGELKELDNKADAYKIMDSITKE